ncbi:MAG TPA: hypothetical protein VG734_01735 [Lacunisphaera sp.]|nr:hypothetical protein [Lacunisphaera sp.]
MAKKNVPESAEREKQRAIADELFKEFENLPAEVRRVVAVHNSTPDILEHVSGGIQRTLDDVQGDATAAALRHAATLVRAHAGHANRVLLDLQAFAGRLEGLAWARDALETAHQFAEAP